MDYPDPIERSTGKALHGRDYLRQLNTVRAALKHQGLYPDATQWAGVGESIYQQIAKWCSDYLNIDFGQLDQSALLLDEEIKQLYAKAKQAADLGSYRDALELVGIALAIVFRNNNALRGLEAGRARSDDAIRLSGFGVHANDFLALQEFLPLVKGYGDEAYTPQWKQSQYGHPGNWRKESVEFCLRTFLDVAIKIQDARWIPSALQRIYLYDQQIEAQKDGVEIWTMLRKDDKGNVITGFEGIFRATPQREVVHTMKRGETMQATVSIAEEPSGNAARDAFYGALGGLKTGKILNVMAEVGGKHIFGNVLASDVRVTCVPRSDEFVKENFPNLQPIEWEPE